MAAHPFPTAVETDINGPSDGRSPSCFMHIPKSAGSSILAALEAALPSGSLAPQRFDTSPFCDFAAFERLRPEARARVVAEPRELLELRRYRAVCGHFSLATLLTIADASSISTVLREPRTRLLSLYMYWRTPNIGDFFAPYRAAEHARGSLAEFLGEPRVAAAVDNQVCRMLLHGDPRLPESGFARESDIEAIAADAIERLDTLGFVGVLELGESAWRSVARCFDVELDPTAVNVTGEVVSPKPLRWGEPLLCTRAFDLLERHTAADRLVYDHSLTRAGLDFGERRRLRDSTFAQQLVKLGSLLSPAGAPAHS